MFANLGGRGLSKPMIADRLCLSTKTGADYVSSILLKLGARDREDAPRRIRSARRTG